MSTAAVSPAIGGGSHAMLITGPEGSGKRAFALQAAGALLCLAPESARMCGKCASCKKVSGGTHPDLIEIIPQKSSFGVDDVRGLLEALSRRPFEGDRRAVLLARAHSMTPQAQNALLKTLEEPGSNTFYLLCDEISTMLPTVRSRCRTVRMLPDMHIAEALSIEGIQSELAQEAALLSGYAKGRARTMLESEPEQKGWEMATRIINIKTSADAALLHSEISQEKNKDVIASALNALEGYMMDILRYLAGSQSMLAQTRDRAGRFTIASCTCIISRIIDTRKRLSANVSWQSASDTLLMEFARFAKGEAV